MQYRFRHIDSSHVNFDFFFCSVPFWVSISLSPSLCHSIHWFAKSFGQFENEVFAFHSIFDMGRISALVPPSFGLFVFIYTDLYICTLVVYGVRYDSVWLYVIYDNRSWIFHSLIANCTRMSVWWWRGVCIYIVCAFSFYFVSFASFIFHWPVSFGFIFMSIYRFSWLLVELLDYFWEMEKCPTPFRIDNQYEFCVFFFSSLLFMMTVQLFKWNERIWKIRRKKRQHRSTMAKTMMTASSKIR